MEFIGEIGGIINNSLKIANGYPLDAEMTKKEGWVVLLPIVTIDNTKKSI